MSAVFVAIAIPVFTSQLEKSRESTDAINLRSAYPAFCDTYTQIDELIEYLNSVDNLYCIGRNGQHRYNNMDHSMVTAFTVIDCMEGRANKTDLWNVNTEQDIDFGSKRPLARSFKATVTEK